MREEARARAVLIPRGLLRGLQKRRRQREARRLAGAWDLCELPHDFLLRALELLHERRGNGRLAIARELERIDVAAVAGELVMKVRAGRKPRRSHVADNLATLDVGPGHHRRRRCGEM